jgi:hypothetical protein
MSLRVTLMDDYQDYLTQRAMYYPERRCLTPDEFAYWQARWDREYAAAWAKEPPDFFTIKALEYQLCA